jgi:hypothetical protein
LVLRVLLGWPVLIVIKADCIVEPKTKATEVGLLADTAEETEIVIDEVGFAAF